MTKLIKSKLLASILLVSAIILAACQNTPSTEQVQGTTSASVSQTLTAWPTTLNLPSTTAVVMPTATPTPVMVQYGPTNFPETIDPLTGLAVGDAAILNRRPVMIKVSNFPIEGRPQAGLSKADIVFDYSIGAGENRFLAVYYGQDSDQVGPIRSGRYIDEWLVSMYQGVLGMMYAYAPEYNEIVSPLGNSRVINGTENTCPAICDKNYGISEINWFANTAEMTKYYANSAGATNSKPNLDGMAFNTLPPAGGKTGSEATVHFGQNNEGQWKYDAAQKKYLGWIDSTVDATTNTMIPWVDRNTNEQLAFSNVIVVFAKYTTLNSKNSIHQVALVGVSGKALFFRDGQVYDGIWKGVSVKSPLQFSDASNQTFELQPGNTWISIVGDLSTATQDQPGIYKITFLTEAYQAGN